MNNNSDMCAAVVAPCLVIDLVASHKAKYVFAPYILRGRFNPDKVEVTKYTLVEGEVKCGYSTMERIKISALLYSEGNMQPNVVNSILPEFFKALDKSRTTLSSLGTF